MRLRRALRGTVPRVVISPAWLHRTVISHQSRLLVRGFRQFLKARRRAERMPVGDRGPVPRAWPPLQRSELFRLVWSSVPAELSDITTTMKHVQELTSIAESELNRVVLDCTRAGRQLIGFAGTTTPTRH